MVFMTQAAGVPALAPNDDDDGWFASQLRRYRSYPHLHQAFQLIHNDKLAEAAKQLEQTIAIDPGNREARLTALEVATRLKRYRQVIAQADPYLLRWPGDPHVLMLRANAKEPEGMRAAAMQDYEAVYRDGRAARADRVLAASAVANWELSHDRPQQALSALDLALRFSDTPGLHLRRGRALAALERAPEAERAFEQALSRSRQPDEQLAALRDLANLALGQHDTAKALPFLQRASALAPKDRQATHQLIQAYFALGRYDEAAEVAKRMLEQSGSAEDAYLQGTIHAARHDPAAAATAYARAAQAADPALRGKALLALGYSAHAARQDKAAREAFAQAAHLPGGQAAARELKAMAPVHPEKKAAAPVPDAATLAKARAQALAGEAYAALAKDQAAQARRLFEQALALNERPVWRAQLADVYRRQGDLAQARELLASLKRPDLRQLRELAAMSLELGDARGGLEVLGRVVRQSNEAQDYLRLARSAQQAGQEELALQAYRVTYAKMGELAPADQASLQAELSYAYLRNGHHAQAIEMLDAAYRQAPRFALALELANLELQRGASGAARERLAAFDPGSMNTEQKQIWYATRAELARQAGELQSSMDLLREGVQAAPNATLHYQLGLAALAANDHALAREQLTQVRRLDPDNWSVALQLGYVCQGLHDLPCAIDAFEQVARVHSDVDGVAEALGYAYTEQGDNDRAVSWFKRAIDRLDGKPSSQRAQAKPRETKRPEGNFREVGYRPDSPLSFAVPAGQAAASPDALDVPQDEARNTLDEQAQKREALRQQIGAMTRSWQLNAYQSVRNGENQQGAGRAVGSGALFSQGGLELQMRVPGLGYQNGRILQMESRLLWGNHPSTLAIDSHTLQGTLGLAYKPFKEQDAYLRCERLIKIGSQSQSNWLLHASWGTADGWGWNPVRSHWNYSTLYADAGVMLQGEHTRSVYGEARQGHAFAVAGRTVLIPHVVLAGRGQRPDPNRESYVEAGAGVSLKASFNGSRYVAERSSLELALQYRKPISPRRGGWAMSLGAQF
jgi:tetratricopeptide (TPR) repeat protein